MGIRGNAFQFLIIYYLGLTAFVASSTETYETGMNILAAILHL